MTATDVSSKFIQLALQKERRQPLGIRYLVRDAAHLSGMGNTFDLVVANMVLMDVQPYQRAIREAARALKQNGQFVFSIVHPLYSDWQHAVVSYKQ